MLAAYWFGCPRRLGWCSCHGRAVSYRVKSTSRPSSHQPVMATDRTRFVTLRLEPPHEDPVSAPAEDDLAAVLRWLGDAAAAGCRVSAHIPQARLALVVAEPEEDNDDADDDSQSEQNEEASDEDSGSDDDDDDATLVTLESSRSRAAPKPAEAAAAVPLRQPPKGSGRQTQALKARSFPRLRSPARRK